MKRVILSTMEYSLSTGKVCIFPQWKKHLDVFRPYSMEDLPNFANGKYLEVLLCGCFSPMEKIWMFFPKKRDK
jgi:hypothetical protein